MTIKQDLAPLTQAPSVAQMIPSHKEMKDFGVEGNVMALIYILMLKKEKVNKQEADIAGDPSDGALMQALQSWLSSGNLTLDQLKDKLADLMKHLPNFSKQVADWITDISKTANSYTADPTLQGQLDQAKKVLDQAQSALDQANQAYNDKQGRADAAYQRYKNDEYHLHHCPWYDKAKWQQRSDGDYNEYVMYRNAAKEIKDKVIPKLQAAVNAARATYSGIQGEINTLKQQYLAGAINRASIMGELATKEIASFNDIMERLKTQSDQTKSLSEELEHIK